MSAPVILGKQFGTPSNRTSFSPCDKKFSLPCL